MNKYTAVGLAQAAAGGARILVLTVDQQDVRFAIDPCLPLATEAQARVYRTNGTARIDYTSGGSLTFRSHRANLRGLSADVIYLDAGVDERAPLLINDLYPLIATGGEITRA